HDAHVRRAPAERVTVGRSGYVPAMHADRQVSNAHAGSGYPASLITAMTPQRMDRKALVAHLIKAVWSEGNVDECDRYLADRYTIHHDPGDPWDGKQLDVAGFKERARVSRAPFPDQRFDIQAMFAD